MSNIISIVSTWVFLVLVFIAFGKALQTWDKTRTDFYRAFMEEKEK